MTVSQVSRLGLIGDVHAEHIRLEKALAFLQQEHVDDILCTGDIVDGDGCPEASVRLLKKWNVRTVRGNHDRWILQDKARHIPDAHLADELSSETIRYLENLPTQIQINTTAGAALLCHGIADDDLRKVWPGSERMGIERSRALDKLIDEGRHRYVINGHMHFRTMIHFSSLTLINAGTLRGQHWPGFSIVDFDEQVIHAYEFRDDNVALAKSQGLCEDHHVIWQNTQSFNGGWEPVRLF